MDSLLVERRQKLVKLRGMGLSLSETVAEICSEYKCSARTVYLDWETRKRWLRSVLEIEDPELTWLEVMARHRELQRLCLKEFLGGDNSASRISALKLMRDLDLDLLELIVTDDQRKRLDVLEKEVLK